MTRQKKSPRQRAEEALAVADRKVVRLDSLRDRLKSDLVVVEGDLAAERRRRDYLATHPDLTQPPTTKETNRA